MNNSVYQINKGINQSIEFKGLKAQYIWYLGGGVVFLMILFSIFYVLGIPSIVCVILIGGIGIFMVAKIYKMSNQFGEFGMMKMLAKKQIPNSIKIYSRRIFFVR